MLGPFVNDGSLSSSGNYLHAYRL